MGRPAYVNVFLGRLNAVVTDNGLGGGDYVGENATLASQEAVRRLRKDRGFSVRQIGASLRDGRQVRDLAGIDVMTMPPKVAKEFVALGLAPEDLEDKTGQRYRPGVTEEGARRVGLDVLWEVDRHLEACVDALEKERLDAFSADRLVEFLEQHGCGGLLVRWREDQVRISAEEGKIPKLDHWGDGLARGTVRLDSLMNLAGWNSFDADQREMDRHVQEVLAR